MITIAVLKIIQEYNINALMKKFPNIPIGTKAVFTHKLQQWKNNNPLNANDILTLYHNL